MVAGCWLLVAGCRSAYHLTPSTYNLKHDRRIRDTALVAMKAEMWHSGADDM
jgi:hypothetical protein